MNHIHEIKLSRELRFYDTFLDKVVSLDIYLTQYCTMLGKIEYLAYAHESGCRSSCNTSIDAGQYGQLECLQYLHDNGCEWHEWICYFAVRKGQLKCLRYALQNGCPYDKNKYIRVAKDSEAIRTLFDELGL